MGKYKFKTAYSEFEAESDAPPQIHDLMRKLRIDVGGIAAVREKDGPSFPVRKAKELFQKLAQAISDLNMVVLPVSQVVVHQDLEKIPADAKGRMLRSAVHVQTTVRFIAPDGSYLDAIGSGGAGDADDKAGGKGDTYAYKVAVLKGLCIPEKDLIDTDDEELGGQEQAPGPARGASPRTVSSSAEAAAKGDPTFYLSRIAACETPEALRELGAEINANAPAAVKKAVHEAYIARRSQLAAGCAS